MDQKNVKTNLRPTKLIIGPVRPAGTRDGWGRGGLGAVDLAGEIS